MAMARMMGKYQVSKKARNPQSLSNQKSEKERVIRLWTACGPTALCGRVGLTTAAGFHLARLNFVKFGRISGRNCFILLALLASVVFFAVELVSACW